VSDDVISFQIKFLFSMFSLKGTKLLLLFFLGWALLFYGFGTLAQSASDGASVSIPEAPNPPKLFNDYVGVVSTSEASDLESMMVRINDSTTVQIAVVVVPTVGQYDIADYAQQLAMKWGIGQRDKNNGVLLVLAMDDRKSRIQVGYGLEGVLSDIKTAQIQDHVLRPLMRQEQYASAISETVNAIYKAAKEEYKVEAPSQADDEGVGSTILGWIIMFVAMSFCLLGFVATIIRYIAIIRVAVLGIRRLLFQIDDRDSGNGSKQDGSNGSSSFWDSFSSSDGTSSGGGFGGGGFGGGGSSGSW